MNTPKTLWTYEGSMINHAPKHYDTYAQARADAFAHAQDIDYNLDVTFIEFHGITGDTVTSIDAQMEVN